MVVGMKRKLVDSRNNTFYEGAMELCVGKGKEIAMTMVNVPEPSNVEITTASSKKALFN